jgi:hypothetical protein
VAKADALSIEVYDSAVPVVPPGQPAVFASPSSTQALFDSLGEATGFASAPYPGEFAGSLPSTVNGLGFGKLPPVPSLPFTVTSSYPGAPSAEQSNGPFGISSVSSATGSTANAHIGLAIGGPSVLSSTAASSATQDPNTGTLVAQADTSVEGLSLGPLLTVGRISAHAKLTALAGKNPTKATSFSVGWMSIAGIPVGLTNNGFQAGPGTPVGLNLSSLTKLLEGAGINLSYLPAVQTPTSVDSAGLAVTFTKTVPTQGPVKTTLILGHVSATAEPGPVSEPSSGAGAPGSTGGSDTGGSAAVGDVSGGNASTSNRSTSPPASSLGSSGPQQAVLAPALSPVLGGNTRTPGSRQPSTASTAGAVFGPLVGKRSSGVYLALAGIGMAIIAAALLFDGLGIRQMLPSTASGTTSVLRLPSR